MSENNEIIQEAINLQQAGKYDEAIKAYEKALKKGLTQKFELFTLLNLGQLNLGYNDNYKTAIDWFLKALEVDNASIHALLGLGKCYGFMKDSDEALSYFQKAAEIDPNEKDVWRNLAVTYIHMKNFNLALDSLLNYIKSSGDNIDCVKEGIGLIKQTVVDSKGSVLEGLVDKIKLVIPDCPPESAELLNEFYAKLVEHVGQSESTISHSCDEDLTPDQELDIAEKVYKEGDFRHATLHIGRALMFEPRNQRGLGLFNKIIKKSEDPLDLIGIRKGEGTYASTYALQAYLLMKQEDYNTAFNIIIQIVAQYPKFPLLLWIEDAVKNSKVVKQISIDNLISQFANNFKDAPESLWKQIVPILDNLSENAPKHEKLAYFHSYAARNASQTERSIEISKKAFKRFNDPIFLTNIATTYKNTGKLEESLTYFKKALNYTPQNESIYLDIADILGELEQYDECIKYYEGALKIDPNNSWALPSLYFYKYITTRDEEWLECLRAYVNDNPNNERAAILYEQLFPYEKYLTEPEEAVINLVRKLGDFDIPDGAKLEGMSESIEAPSALFVLNTICNAQGVEVDYSFMKTPKPDPRVPRKDIKFNLWKLDGKFLTPAINPPNDTVCSLISDLAILPYNLKDWSERAKEIAEKLKECDISPLLGVMVHPPKNPEEIALWNWVQRVQIATALTISHMDGEWEDSTRRDALLSLLNGPIDWVTIAAIIALSELTKESNSISGSILGEFLDLFEAKPKIGYWCVEKPLIWAILRNASLDEKNRSIFEKLRKNIKFSLFF